LFLLCLYLPTDVLDARLASALARMSQIRAVPRCLDETSIVHLSI
jgi:hypothetical protein